MSPYIFRLLLFVASWMVPSPQRKAWRGKWSSQLANWWILVDRGELTLNHPPMPLEGMFAHAFWKRFQPEELVRWMCSAWAPVACAAVVLLAMGVISDGFAVTRSLVETAHSIQLQPLKGGVYDPRGDRLVGYVAPILLSFAIGLSLAWVLRIPVLRYGWRYRAFAVFKVAAIAVILPLFWVEGGAALRHRIPFEGIRVLAGGLGLGLAFVALFAMAVRWAIADQRLRCPECLHLLVWPVRIGTWASVFEPVTTELVCGDGHGVLCIAEREGAAEDHWTALDESWR